MKLTSTQAEQIAHNLRAALKEKEIIPADLARLTGLDASRVSRILRGHFATPNPAVMQICNFLGVHLALSTQSAGIDRIAASALKIWDGTERDVAVVVALLDQIAVLRDRV